MRGRIYEKQVKLDKTDDAYPYDNEFTINLNHVAAAKLQDFQLIYTDYKHCALFWSWNLGYQVWVESSFLKTQRKRLQSPREATLRCKVNFKTSWIQPGCLEDETSVGEKEVSNLIENDRPQYRLMFHSQLEGSVQAEIRCLCTTSSSPSPGEQWKRNVLYRISPNSTTT
ncbi:hypothetical protein V5799_021945 [Amblyomma americanum]|uniref:Uncharacterized protein n=1 Tax=Amblyomma americanum TaxID=6943 RepID=A0AAQ4FNE2_AMBAM